MNKGCFGALVILFLLTIGCFGYSMTLQKKNVTCNNNGNNNSSFSEEDALRTVQKLYEDVYIKLGGTFINNDELVNISIGSEELVGGQLNVEAYKIDFGTIEKYFTKRATNYLKTFYTDTPYGHSDGNYYIFLKENVYSSNSKKDLVSTIFNTTDDSVRKLKIVSYNDKVIVAVSENTSFTGLDEYIIFKLENGDWKIDMFENF